MKIKKIISLLLVLGLLITLSPRTAFAEGNKPDSSPSTTVKSDDSVSKVMSVYGTARRKEAKKKFDEKYGTSRSFKDARGVSPNGTYYELVNLDWVLTPYLLILTPTATEFEVVSISKLVPSDVKLSEIDFNHLLAPTDDRVVVTYIIWTAISSQRDDGSTLVDLTGNMGIIIDTVTKKEVKTVSGGCRLLQGENEWLSTDSHIYAVENLSTYYDPDRPDVNFSPGEVFAYSLKTGEQDKKFVLTPEAVDYLCQITTEKLR